jgi:hypothetical protein
MKIEMRRELARQPFEQKIRQVGQLIQLSSKVKSRTRNEAFNGAKLSESVLVRDWDSPREDAAGKKL